MPVFDMRTLLAALALVWSAAASAQPADVTSYPLAGPSVPQQIKVGQDGRTVWFAAANLGAIGKLDPATGETIYFALGNGARPRGLAIGPDNHVFALDQQLNLIHELDPASGQLRRHVMPEDAPHLDLAEATLGGDGRIWFTGYAGWFGALNPSTGETQVWSASTGRGLYSIAAGAGESVWIGSVAGNAIAMVNTGTGAAEWFTPPKGLVAGLKGLAVDKSGQVWLAAGRNGRVVRFDARRKSWFVYKLPGEAPRPHAITATGDGRIVVTDTAAHKLLSLDPGKREFVEIADLTERGMAKHIAERNGSIFIAEAASDLVLAVRLSDLKLN